VNPQPTIEDLYKSIEMARQCNMRMLHLAGHAEEECGFIWNANDQATASKSFDIEAISLAIGAVAGQQGPLECVVLNACCTLKMGRLLRRRGVPNVLCWQTPVNDETARELCERFFRPLVEEKQAGKRDYKAAFAAAMNEMRPLSHTHGAKDLPHTVGVSASVGARGGQRGIVNPWEEEDVVLFLSNDGESEPIYLWRKRPVASAPLPATSEVEETVDAGLKEVFEQHGLGAVCIDVCRELGVTCLSDLEKHVTAQDVDDLPKYVKDTLKPAQKSKLKALIGRQLPAVGGRALLPRLSPARLVTCSTRGAERWTNLCLPKFAAFDKHSKDSLDVHGEAGL
jgi:hypothetical protein